MWKGALESKVFQDVILQCGEISMLRYVETDPCGSVETQHHVFTVTSLPGNCEYCMRLLTISNLYNILYQHQCFWAFT